MPLTLVETIDSHHGALLRALDEIEALVRSRGHDDALARALDKLRRTLLAHELTSEEVRGLQAGPASRWPEEWLG